MIRASLARTAPTYEGVTAPFYPGEPYPELQRLLQGRVGPPNPVYAAVRDALRGLGLDEARFGTADWNPLSDLVKPDCSIVLKPNFIRHWNPMEGRGGTVQSVITHGAVVRAMADYAFLAAGSDGTVTVAEAPQMDCNYSRVAEINALEEVEQSFRRDAGRDLRIVDMRREEVLFKDGVIVERINLPGDPAGYRAVDLGERSFFTGSGLDPNRFRGADYDSGPTVEHHKNGRNAYLLSETVLSADLVVNLPKLKTHKKTGVTLALKNMVGINGDKNWLPHHSLGSVNDGGDEFPEQKFIDRLRSRATDVARPLLAKGKGLAFFRAARRMETAVRGDTFIRSGNWYGNRTTWRMCCDLNRCLYYSDRTGLHMDASKPVRPVLTVIDGILAGEGEGPLAPVDVPLGAVIASSDPVAADLVAVRLMGFDEAKLAKLWEPMQDDMGPRITAVRTPSDVVVGLVVRNGAVPSQCNLDDIVCERRFAPHAGWAGHIERDPKGHTVRE